MTYTNVFSLTLPRDPVRSLIPREILEAYLYEGKQIEVKAIPRSKGPRSVFLPTWQDIAEDAIRGRFDPSRYEYWWRVKPVSAVVPYASRAELVANRGDVTGSVVVAIAEPENRYGLLDQRNVAIPEAEEPAQSVRLLRLRPPRERGTGAGPHFHEYSLKELCDYFQWEDGSPCGIRKETVSKEMTVTPDETPAASDETTTSPTEAAEELNLDVSAEQARALHRVVRAMHDGHCPKCGHLGPAESFDATLSSRRTLHVCPRCHFRVSHSEAKAALKAFQPCLAKSVEIFERWRAANQQTQNESE